jgi:hypothetical protein
MSVPKTENDEWDEQRKEQRAMPEIFWGAPKGIRGIRGKNT